MTKENACSRTDEQLALAAQGGSSDALAQLIPRFLPMIRQKAGRYSFVGLEQDDFVQEGLIGLLSAVQNYDPGRNASFRTFAALCIQSRMSTCLNRLFSQKHLPLNDYLPIDSLPHRARPERLRPVGGLPPSGGGTDSPAENKNPFVWIRTGNPKIVPQRSFL